MVIMISNRADPDEMPHYAASHLGLLYFIFSIFLDTVHKQVKKREKVRIVKTKTKTIKR